MASRCCATASTRGQSRGWWCCGPNDGDAGLRGDRAQLDDPRSKLLGDGQSTKQRRGLLELLHHGVDGSLSVAAHDAVEGVKKVLLDGLVCGVADVLLGDGAD